MIDFLNEADVLGQRCVRVRYDSASEFVEELLSVLGVQCWHTCGACPVWEATGTTRLGADACRTSRCSDNTAWVPVGLAAVLKIKLSEGGAHQDQP